MKLRLGQRGKGHSGWLNLDSHPSADIVATLPPLPTTVTSAKWELIEAIHVWEHFYLWEARSLAREVHASLTVGGQLVLECPNLEVACRSFLGEYKDSNQYHMHVFYGDPSKQDASYGHRWGYTPETLADQLVEYGGFRYDAILIERAKHHVPDRDFRIVATRSE
jgi:predicted SAM-dependent methyltransferase